MTRRPLVACCSFRLGRADGVSVVAESWLAAFRDLGWDTRTVAGDGPVDVLVPGLGLDDDVDPAPDAVRDALDGADLVLVENLLTIPLRLTASLAVAEVLRGRPALLHHHDPPWQRERFAHITALPVDDPAWRHVTINRLTEAEFAARGLRATTVYNGFALDPAPPGARAAVRRRLGVADGRALLLHPVRAIARKEVPRALALAEAVGGTYWLPGPAEEGYGPTLERILAGAGTDVRRDPLGRADVPAAYAACDAVLFPSSWEGFGNPPIEAALARRPVVVGDYPVATELRALGFRWLPVHADALAAALRDPAALADDLAHNEHLARTQLSQDRMAAAIAALLAEPGWLPADVRATIAP
jgi:glycosyltransferase involved in cell wall biosynthesis